jgi:ATP-dependent Zn protease
MKPYSVKVNKVIDQEIKLIIDRCTEITKGMIAKHEKDIKNLSDELLKRETLDGKQIRAILG